MRWRPACQSIPAGGYYDEGEMKRLNALLQGAIALAFAVVAAAGIGLVVRVFILAAGV